MITLTQIIILCVTLLFIITIVTILAILSYQRKVKVDDHLSSIDKINANTNDHLKVLDKTDDHLALIDDTTNKNIDTIKNTYVKQDDLNKSVNTTNLYAKDLKADNGTLDNLNTNKLLISSNWSVNKLTTSSNYDMLGVNIDNNNIVNFIKTDKNVFTRVNTGLHIDSKYKNDTSALLLSANEANNVSLFTTKGASGLVSSSNDPFSIYSDNINVGNLKISNKEDANINSEKEKLKIYGNSADASPKKIELGDNVNVVGSINIIKDANVNGSFNVNNNLKADNSYTQTNNIRFSNKLSDFSTNATDKSEISNDTTDYKQLMVVGNKSAGAERRVGVWDRLDVHGDLGVDNKTKTNRLQLGDKFSLSGVGEAHGNDDWLRFFNKDGTDYYGGIAAGKLWTKDVSYLNGTTNVNGNAQFQNNGTGVVWGNNYSKIYDDGNLHIDTDDYMFMKAPVALSVDAKKTAIKGTLGVGADIPSDWSGANFARRDGRWSHLDWKDNGQNYLRGYTNIDDGLAVNGKTTIGGNFSIDGATMYNKGRQHIHGEELLYLLNKSGVIIGKEWGGNGNLNVQGNLGVGGNIPGDWRSANFARKDGRWSHLDWKDNGQNYLRGYTNIDDGVNVNGNTNLNGMTTISRGNGDWNWLRVTGNYNDNVYLGSDGRNRGIWADTAPNAPTRDFTIFNQGQPGLTVKPNGDTNVNNMNVANKICINSTCITEADLKRILAKTA